MFRESADIKSDKDNGNLSNVLEQSTVTSIRYLKIDTDVLKNIKIKTMTVYADDKSFYRLLDFKRKFNTESDYFICRVEGDDLSNLNIDKNAEIIIKRQNYALNGQIVLVIYQGKCLLKKYYKNKDLIYLMSGQNNVNKMDVSNEPFEIMGGVIEVFSKIEKL